MTPQEFITKWKRADLSERSAYQQHFLDLCDLLGQRKPAEADPEGAWYTFERGVRQTTGRQGWADVWMRGHFGWEYKKKRRDLRAAYDQLLRYREDLENPPLLIVCDLDRFEVHTNFTGTAKQVHAFDLDGLAEPQNLDVLRRVFTDPESLRPGLTTARITEQAAERFGLLADGMRVRGIDAHRAAHFLMKLMFCMFGEDIELLPEKLFTQTLKGAKDDPPRLAQRLAMLFQAMAGGGDFGPHPIKNFDGDLFADADVVELTPDEIRELVLVNEYDWAYVEPSIFGTLFERTLDPAKRSQIGAHYTSREDILTLLEPVVMAPLRREWAQVRAKADDRWNKFQADVRKRGPKAPRRTAKKPKLQRDFERTLLDFIERLDHVRILDPACGSGNFLYVAINLLLDLEKEVITYAAGHDLGILPHVRPTQLAGIEINPYAQQLAQVVIWIGYLQWMYHNGFIPPSDPVLEPIEGIELKDAILDLSDPDNPKEPEWPEADFIVGNPPFLGDNRMRREVGDRYLKALLSVYRGRVARFADLCCYWFEKAREVVAANPARRAGLVAPESIRTGDGLFTLSRIKHTGDIFFAISNRDWIQEGHGLHVSIICFDCGAERRPPLSGELTRSVSADLTKGIDVTRAVRLRENRAIAFQGERPLAPFEFGGERARQMLLSGGNPSGRPNSDVIWRGADAQTLVQTRNEQWTIDFGDFAHGRDLTRYLLPIELVREVLRKRPEVRRDWLAIIYRPPFGRHGRSSYKYKPRSDRVLQLLWLPGAVSRFEQARYIAVPSRWEHLIFVWVEASWIPSDATIVFARSDDYAFGVLHSRSHEVWARRQGSHDPTAETRFHYTPTTCFETFPFPEPTEEQRLAIAEAARELDEPRNRWLNPPEWTREEVLEFPGSVDGPWARYVHDPDDRGIGTVRYPRTVAKDDECAKEIKKRTLTNLYNQRPTWLTLAHQKLDAAVFAAYGWDAGMGDEEILENLLVLNLSRSATR